MKLILKTGGIPARKYAEITLARCKEINLQLTKI